ncbi:hypothetical protein BG74_09075 [Sodalis-like endosymbiont of Proechinophthirus fluctus]|nr:hypothetical protein BG74_09075 [Sodalis-like endosymbiont of Proechinophthirus fluctus]
MYHIGIISLHHAPDAVSVNRQAAVNNYIIDHRDVSVRFSFNTNNIVDDNAMTDLQTARSSISIFISMWGPVHYRRPDVISCFYQEAKLTLKPDVTA